MNDRDKLIEDLAALVTTDDMGEGSCDNGILFDHFIERARAVLKASQVPTLTAIPDYGDVLPLEEWRGEFTSYDGMGHWATLEGMDRNSDVWESKPPKWATHVVWFNK